MDKQSFTKIRAILNKTQTQMAQLLGVSIKAVHSYEQGWRRVPPHVERQMYFLASRRRNVGPKRKSCWIINKCPARTKKACPAWEFQAGDLCWFINGTICGDKVHADWREKMVQCRECPVFLALGLDNAPEDDDIPPE